MSVPKDLYVRRHLVLGPAENSAGGSSRLLRLALTGAASTTILLTGTALTTNYTVPAPRVSGYASREPVLIQPAAPLDDETVEGGSGEVLSDADLLAISTLTAMAWVDQEMDGDAFEELDF